MSDHYAFQNSLGEIRDVNWEFFQEHETDTTALKPMRFPSTRKISYEKRLELVREIIEKKLDSPEWISEAVPADYIVYQRSIGMQGEAEALKKLQTDLQSFRKDIQRSFS